MMDTLDVKFIGENDEIMIVTLNRPDVMNAMSIKLIEELISLFREQSNNEKLRCAIITGAGYKAFSAGADLKERKGMENNEWRRQQRIIEEMVLEIMDFPVPVIAAVEGYALAGGMEVALMADFIIASETAVFGLTEVTIGILPGAGGPQNLTKAIGKRRAKELIYTGRKIDANLAYKWGLVNRVVPAKKSLDEAVETAYKIIDSAPISVKVVKKAIDRGTEVDFHTGYVLDLAFMDVLVSTEDRLEGTNAFKEKRKPVWKNR
jgi:enoyl-CoA hydratase